MLSLIIIMLVGLLIAFFAGQNTQPVTLAMSEYRLAGIPLYIVVVGAMLLGFVISWLISLIDTVSNVFRLRGKDSAIRESERTVTRLKDRIHELEIENARLRGDRKEPRIIARERHEEDTGFLPTLFDRLRHSFR